MMLIIHGAALLSMAQPVGGGDPPAESVAPIVFSEITEDAGIVREYPVAWGMTVGVNAVDYDDDGFTDIFLPTASGSHHLLYRNLGDGTFEDVSQQVGLTTLRQARTALWFDADADGLLDILLLGDCVDASDPECVNQRTSEFYRQVAPHQFELATEQAGFASEILATTGMHRGGAAAGDLNADGALDVVFGTWAEEARVLVNAGDGTFLDESLACGIGGVTGGHWQPVIHDFNSDGLMDVYWAIDFRENHLWINQGDGTFQDEAASCDADIAFNDMGVALQDFDDDGDADIYITEIFSRKLARHNPLLRNDTDAGVLAFTDVAIDAGVSNTAWGWGTTGGDFDLDGSLDLAATNGFFNPPHDRDRSRLYIQAESEPLRFANVTHSGGFNDALHGGGLVSFDFDRDGDLDLLQVSPEGVVRLLENRCLDSCDENWIVIQPRPQGSNPFGVGATIRATVDGRTMTRYILAGDSSLSQHPLEAHFGLGDAALVELLRIEWPDGTASEFTDVVANQVLRIP